MSRKTYFREQKTRRERKRPRCPTCHKRIRGENHEKGEHHRKAVQS